jgi:hypothetical protein
MQQLRSELGISRIQDKRVTTLANLPSPSVNLLATVTRFIYDYSQSFQANTKTIL